ncbi:MAG: O-antigen ligase family protein [Saprospiraceae bacterium]|nr:O-antigen ligase family protein [Saprospiraceae bacterium]MDW8229301.1 O-antigen ligase family protein [Saprospiraceae bacterium]
MVRKLAIYFFWLVVAIAATYYLPEFARTPLYVLMLIAYARSSNEPMWLALFLTVGDGVWGFFNPYEAVTKLLPGLPGIEFEQLYVLAAFIKSLRKESPEPMFHRGLLRMMGVYIILLVLQGYAVGLSPALNVQFRLVKFLLPLTLLYSLPRLLRTEEDYRELFFYVFPMVFLALFAQVFTIATSLTPSQALGVMKKVWFTVDVKKGYTYRGFYSDNSVLLGYFGTFYWLTRPGFFDRRYLFSVLAAAALCVVLSATRGWIIGFTLSLVLFLILVEKLSLKQTFSLGMVGTLAVVLLLQIPVIEKQFANAFERFSTLQKLAGGDVTAGGTLSRLNERSPRVMDKWSESPISGWGFSDEFFKYGDFHVANQNILLHAGIIGAILMLVFILGYHGTLFLRSWQMPRGAPHKQSLLVWCTFFPGWFFIHSTSGQKFAFYADPTAGMVIGVYLTLGALVYRLSFNPPSSAGG